MTQGIGTQWRRVLEVEVGLGVHLDSRDRHAEALD